jgi:hypothetical protein
MSDTGYQGWANYPTWAVNLWLSNEESLYREATRIALTVVDEVEWDENVTNGIWSIEEAERFRTADALKDLADELSPELGASFAADLYGWALGQVEWNEIACAWLETARENREEA